MDKHELTDRIKRQALELGFSEVGITTADDFDEYDELVRSRPDYALWTDPESARNPNLSKGSFPKKIWPQAKSIISLIYAYGHTDFPDELTPYIGRAYLSRSYVPLSSNINGVRVNAFKDYLRTLGIGVYSDGGRLDDTNQMADLPDRQVARRAGTAHFGKNNFLRTASEGSFITAYSVMVDVELDYDEPDDTNACPPDCHLCIDACPTGALAEPYRLHPMKCILMQNLSPFAPPLELREGIGTHIHGCDECQTVCPHNRPVIKKACKRDALLEDIKDRFDLGRMVVLDEEYYNDVVRPIMFNYISPDNLTMFRKNAAIAIGNTEDPSYIPALEKALVIDDNPALQEAAMWALERLREVEAKETTDVIE